MSDALSEASKKDLHGETDPYNWFCAEVLEVQMLQLGHRWGLTTAPTISTKRGSD